MIRDLDAHALARRQIALDTAATRERPGLFAHKVARMRASPFALLRGSAPLFEEILAARPVFAAGPRGRGWIVGDLHVENFGAYRGDDDAVRFDINDFDEAARGPLRFDLLRLCTSLVLVARSRGADGPRAIALVHALLHAYAQSLQHAREPAPPPCVKALVSRAGSRTRQGFLDARTEVLRGARRFVRESRYLDIEADLRDAAAEAFARYLESLSPERRPRDVHCAVRDVAFRVAGTGSLGVLRLAVLTEGKGGPDGGWIFDVKACASRPRVGGASERGAARVLAGMRACLEHPPQLAGSTTLRRRSMLVRRLAPQEDKLDAERVPLEELGPLSEYLGALTGRAHRRGALALDRRIRDDALDPIAAHALELAGLHEAIYLAYCAR